MIKRGLLLASEAFTPAALGALARHVEARGYDSLWLPDAFGREPVATAAHLLPQGRPDETIEPWRSGLQASGVDPATRRLGIIRSCLVTDDRERDWAWVKPSEVYRMKKYGQWAQESGDDVAEFKDPERIPQHWVIGDAQACIEELDAFIARYGFTDLVTWAAPPGLRPARMNDSLERLARDVIPELRRRHAARGAR